MEEIILPKHKELFEEVIKRYKKTNFFYYGAYDETFFSLQVYKFARILLKNTKADEELVLVSAILHDIGKTLLNEDLMFKNPLKKDQSEWNKHPKLGVNLSKKILKKFNYDKEFIEKVCFIVENHANRKKFNKEKSIELQIVQDADCLADGGFAQIIRPFLYSRYFKISTNDQINYILENYSDRYKDMGLNLNKSKIIAKKLLKEEKELILKIKNLKYLK